MRIGRFPRHVVSQRTQYDGSRVWSRHTTLFPHPHKRHARGGNERVSRPSRLGSQEKLRSYNQGKEMTRTVVGVWADSQRAVMRDLTLPVDAILPVFDRESEREHDGVQVGQQIRLQTPHEEAGRTKAVERGGAAPRAQPGQVLKKIPWPLGERSTARMDSINGSFELQECPVYSLRQ